MSHFFDQIIKHFVLSDTDPQSDSVSAERPGPARSLHDAEIREKMPRIKSCLNSILSASDQKTFSSSLRQAKEDLRSIIPYEKDFSFTCPLPSEILQMLTEKEPQLKKACRKRAAALLHYDSMDGDQFEAFCARLLKQNGFSNVTITKGSGDQGIDILAEKDSVRYGIQCKCHRSNVGNKAVQEAFAGAGFYNCHLAVVLTNRDFTQAARQLAEKNGVILWNRSCLERFILESVSGGRQLP